MGDGRERIADSRFMSHATAYLASWSELDKNKPAIIPSYMPQASYDNRLPITLSSMICGILNKQEVSRIFDNEIKKFASGRIGAIWMPYSDIMHWAKVFRFIEPKCSKPEGYEIIVSKPVFERALFRNQRARELYPSYNVLVAKILDEIRMTEREIINA